MEKEMLEIENIIDRCKTICELDVVKDKIRKTFNGRTIREMSHINGLIRDKRGKLLKNNSRTLVLQADELIALEEIILNANLYDYDSEMITRAGISILEKIKILKAGE